MEKKPLKFVWHYIKIFKWFFISILFLSAIAQFSGQVYPYFLAKIYDTAAGQVGSETYWSDILNYALMALLLGLIKVLGTEGMMFIWAYIFPNTRTIVLRDVFDYVNKHSISYFNKEMTGNISNKVNQLEQGVVESMRLLFENIGLLFFISSGVVLLGIVSKYFLFAVLLWLYLIVVAGIMFGRKRSAMSRMTSKNLSLTQGVIVDSISNYSEVKNFGNFHFEKLNLLKYLRKLRKVEGYEAIVKAWMHFSQNMITVLSMLGFLFLAIYVFKKNYITTAQFIYANSLFMIMSNAVFQISWTYNNLARVYGQIKAALVTLAVEPEIVDKPNAVKLNVKKADIEFKNVAFSYKENVKLFTDLNLKIKEKEKIGLVGLSGSGKSSFVKLIARYYDVDSGSILINGTDVKDVTQVSLHKAISTIPQDISLFNRTLYDNIRYGKTNATQAQVIAAAKKAHAHKFISEFPEGYQTKVGERGVILSGGERQRIAIARAILKNSPILIFDEATSALDSQSEKYIQHSIKSLMKNKTVIAIAHRLSTLREMDRILVFKKGKIVEQGSHLSLVRKKGLYSKLFKMQVDGFMGGTDQNSEQDTVL